MWVVINPNDNEKLFASVVDHIDGGIFRSLDGGNTWNKLNLPSRTEGRPYTIRVLNDGGVVASFCARAQEDQVTLTPSSGVFYSPDGGDTWFDRTDSRMQFYTKDIIIDLNDSEQNTWYASTWGRFTVFEGPNNSGNGGIYGGNVTLTDGTGSIVLYTKTGTTPATFATTSYPTPGPNSVTGVLQQFNATYQISIRTTADIQ